MSGKDAGRRQTDVGFLKSNAESLGNWMAVNGSPADGEAGSLDAVLRMPEQILYSPRRTCQTSMPS